MMEPTTRSGSRPQQQHLAFDGGTEQRDHAEGAQPTVSSDPNVYPTPLNGYPAELSNSPRAHDRSPVWLQRVWLIVYVVFCIELGMLLAILPWTQVWSNNGLLANLPQLRALLQNGFLRGIITGLGLVDIWLGIWEAVHYRERRN